MSDNNEKKWYLSKTEWLAVLAVAIAVLETVQNGGSWIAAALAGFGVLVGILRPFSTKKLTK